MSTPEKTEEAERRGLAPGEFPRKLVPSPECSGSPVGIGRERRPSEYSARELQNSTM